METIELKPTPLRYAVRLFLFIFISLSILKYLLFGWYSHPDMWFFLRARAIEGLAGTATFLIVFSALCPWKCLRIILDEKTIQAPVKKGARMKSITVNISDICVSRTRKDWFNGTQVITNEGDVLQIGPLFYASKAVPHLLDEIEKRQEI